MARTFTRTALQSSATVGEQLLHARESKELIIETCSHDLNIHIRYLEALEQSRYKDLPGELYAKAWVKKYGEYLGIAPKPLMIAFEREAALRKNIIPTTTTQPSATPRSKKLKNIWSHITMRRLVTAAIILLILGYLGFLFYQSYSPPKVTFTDDLQDFRTQENSIIIKGQTDSGVTVKVNSQQINLDDEGAFNQEVVLQNGLNTISIEARKKHSRSFVKELRIIKSSLPLLQATTTGP